MEKVKSKVNFATRLNVSSLLCKDVESPPKSMAELEEAASAGVRGASYELYALVEHLGSYHQGHYRAFAKLASADPGTRPPPPRKPCLS
jgi:hypothetical protein